MLKKVYCIATARSENRKCKGYAMLGKKCCYIHRAQEPIIKIEVKQSPATNGACQVIKGDDKKCKNYARKGLTCCWSHRALENTEYVPEPETEPETDSEPESEPERHACCCLTMKGNPCAIVAEHVRGDKKYCWRHWRDIEELDSESEVIELLFC
jgi:hypothetical protein